MLNTIWISFLEEKFPTQRSATLHSLFFEVYTVPSVPLLFQKTPSQYLTA